MALFLLTGLTGCPVNGISHDFKGFITSQVSDRIMATKPSGISVFFAGWFIRKDGRE